MRECGLSADVLNQTLVTAKKLSITIFRGLWLTTAVVVETRLIASLPTINRVSTNAQKILDVREKYLKQGASLADLYGDNFDLAFTDLRDAHKELDIEVLKLYGLKATASETDMVTRLFEMFNELISK